MHCVRVGGATSAQAEVKVGIVDASQGTAHVVSYAEDVLPDKIQNCTADDRAIVC